MPDPQYFQYGEKEIAYLRSRDPLLGVAIDEIGQIERVVIPDLFMALVNTIVGQQISTKAQATIWARMREQFVPLTPEIIGTATAEELRTCGISLRKASYIKEIAGSVLNGSLDLAHLQTLPDDEVCLYLSQIKGIGVWTAEMLMTFSMQRPDVMSAGDLAILRGLRMLYHHRKITPKLFARYKRRYSPYATVASLYLWAIAGGACPGLIDHAPKSDVRKKADAKKQQTEKS
ncbi:DNA-3-methyladenine glycosylase II [Syntrophobotulus glycolicus DSM 8271]|uniref:DNA-3-methyladenine glycosylase II n=1 Tax=Syntrophobotulus glycolicus (strain DSM 8271 / FlGlyR) TaxID=645991 RepID=F0SX44_SYNGF|nr:DNA-3-methyladenine glycosylase [Syntrophobotulus glycolicus]ADY55827.1 DNA-3-methyladenine glycosylase II [Syntrophobotulus glycolicus DSM 8271]